MKHKTTPLRVQSIPRAQPTLGWQDLPILGEDRSRARRTLATRLLPAIGGGWIVAGLIACRLWGLL